MSESPLLDTRNEEQVALSVSGRVAGYIPEWQPAPGSTAAALTRAYARFRTLLDSGVRQMPDRLRAAMLDMFGLRLLPARGARVPLVFSISAENAADVTLAAGSQAAATAQAQLPSLEPGALAPQPAEPPLFATERTVTLTPGRLACLYSLDPGSDRYSDHTMLLTAGFETFSGMKLTPHELYLGHDSLFALGGNDISLIVSFLLDSGAREPVNLQWEYFSESGWVPLPYVLEEDTTGGLMTSGQVTLRRVCGPNAKKAAIMNRESYWIRATLATPFPAGLTGSSLSMNDIRVRVKFRKDGLRPEAAFADVLALDTSKSFYPFGERPGLTAVFYLASKEVFSRSGGRVRLTFDLKTTGHQTTSPVLAWEYLSDDGWEGLSIDNPFNFTDTHGVISFDCPADWDEAEVNGTRNRWLRARLTSGNFGVPASYTGSPPSYSADTFAPPLADSVTLAFDYLTAAEPLNHCVSFNDFRFADETADALWPDRRFQPFKPVADRMPAVHFGFDRKPPAGLASMYFQSPVAGASPGAASPFQWEYLAADGWHELPVLDETAGFQRSGMIQFIAAPDMAPADGFNGTLYRIRARLRRGEEILPAAASGIWLNAAWGIHRRNIQRELLGRSNGNPDQTFQFAATPVLEGEKVEVEEWTGRGEGWRLALAGLADDRLRFDRDPVSGEVVRVWVSWSARPHLLDAGPDDRVYTLERATGRLSLGPRVPLARQRLVATYTTGGGVGGNVGTGAVKTLRLVQPMITGVTNPVAAAGGADSEPLAAALRRGPQVLRHRNRALTVQDVEWLALEASPQVARARCLPLAGPDGHAQRGWFRLLVAPKSTDPRPAPSEELAREIQEFLTRHGAGGVRVQVTGARYMAVALRAIIVPDAPGDSALVEERVRAALARFLHPLTGNLGPGWEFGQAVAVSRVAALVESTPGVAYATSMVLTADGGLCSAYARPDADVLPCEGAHELIFRTGEP